MQVKGIPNAEFYFWEKETGTCWSLKFCDEGSFELVKSNQLLDPLSENNPFRQHGLLWEDKKGLDEYMSGIVYENHWLENGRVKYNVGKIGRGMQTTIDKGSVVRIINSFSGDILEEESEKIYRMLKMTEVTFVKYKDLTVLPYPLKLLKEAARMEIEL